MYVIAKPCYQTYVKGEATMLRALGLGRIGNWFVKSNKDVVVADQSKEKEEEKKLSTTQSAPEEATSTDNFSSTQEELKNFSEKLQILLNKYLTKKYEIAGIQEHTSRKSVTKSGEKTQASKLASHFTEFFSAAIKKAISSPHENVSSEIDAANPHINDWKKNIEDLFDALDWAATEEEKKEIKLKICNDAIHLIEELIGMTNAISQDLSINSAEITGVSIAASAALKVIILATTGISFPSTDFGIERYLRDQAFENLKNDKVELEISVTDLMATMTAKLQSVDNNNVVKKEGPKKVTKQDVVALHELNLGNYTLSQLNQLKLQRGILRKPEEPKEESTLRRTKSFSSF